MLFSLNRSFISLMSFVLVVSAVTSLTAKADGPISTNPDDYDVAKYQRLADESAGRRHNAKELLESLNQRLNEVTARLAKEQAEFDGIARDADANRQAIENSEARNHQLRQSIETAQRELNQLQNEIPAVEVALLDEQRRHSNLADHVAQAEQNATALEANARDRAARAQSLVQNSDQKRQALSQAQEQYNNAAGKLSQAESQRVSLQKQIDDLRTNVAQLSKQLDAAKAATATLEIETATKLTAFQQADSAAIQAEKEALEAERTHAADAGAKRKKAMGLRRQSNAARAAYEASDRSLNAARAQVANLDSSLTTTRSKLAPAETQFAAVDGQVLALRQQVAALRPALELALREAQQAQVLAAAATNEASQAQTQAVQARQTANDIRGGLIDSDKKLAELQGRIDKLHQRKDNLTSAIGGWSNEANTESQKVNVARERARQLAEVLERKRRHIGEIQEEFNRASVDRDRGMDMFRDADREADFYRQRLAEITANLNQGIATATNDGVQDGGADGSTEGARQGVLRGQSEGSELGEREGRAQGIREGMDRARVNGTNDGQTVGTNDGTQKGTADGRDLGQSEGTAKGREKGLVDGFEAGRSEGYAAAYPKGLEAGHAMGGLDKGKTDGMAQGKARAQAEGTSKGNTDGTLKGNQEFNNANLADATLPNHTATPGTPNADDQSIVASPSDVKSANFDRPQWGNYNPHRGYPQADMQRAYNNNYQQSFYATAGETYDRTYPGSYDRAHRESFDRNRQDYANREYPEARKAAYDTAYATARDTAYGIARDASARAAYDTAFDIAHTAALPERKEEGRTAGNGEGFEKGKSIAYDADVALGLQQGDKAGWEENYQPTYSAAAAAAYAKVVAYFSSNTVLKFDGAVTADANGDGVYAPGESVSLTLAIKNFGKVSQAAGQEVTVALSAPTPGLILDSATDTIAPLPGQTRAVVTGVTSFRVAPTAEAGKTESVTMTLIQGGTAIGQAQLTINVGYPYAVTSVDHADYPVSGANNAVSVNVRNGSSKGSSKPVTARLVSIDGLATVTVTSADLGALAAGESKAAALAFTFGDTNANKVLNFEVQIFEGDWLLGKRRFNVDSAKRWQYTADTTGLFVLSAIGGDLARGIDEASKIAGLGFDTYDVRVEGPLTSEVALKYLGKAIVLTSVNSSLGDGTAVAIKDFIERGGSVYAGQDSGALRSTAVGSVLASFTESVSGMQIETLVVYQANSFNPNDSKAMVVVGSGLAFDSPATIAANLLTFDLLRKSFSDKVAAFAAAASIGNQTRLTKATLVVLYDLTKEMRDNAAVKGDNFKKHKDALKLTAFINIALSKSGQERHALLGLYPSLETARTQVEEDGWFKSTPIKDVLKPLKKAFEADRP